MEPNARADGIQPAAEVKALNDKQRSEQLRAWREWRARETFAQFQFKYIFVVG